MSINFTDFFQRLSSATGIRNQMDLARALGLNRSAITQAKTRDSVPQKWILALARKYTLSPDWLEFGTGEARPAAGSGTPALFSTGKNTRPPARSAAGTARKGMPPSPAATDERDDVYYIPKAAARLCAGGGSFEMDAEPVAHYPLSGDWLRALGRPSGMLFMDVVGDSMEPGICHGDMVLIDRNSKDLSPVSILAVGYEDAIYLKRVRREADGLVMLSDNPAYGPVPLYGDELNSFHVIGTMVWLCRTYR